MSLKKQNIDPKKNEEELFEKKLLHALKHYGYLFPENISDVERFESIYGDTEIDMPEHLENADNIIKESKEDFDLNLFNNMAAFSSSDQSDFEFPDDFMLDENDDDING